MKKTYKALSIIGVISLVLGLVLIILGLSFGSYHKIGIGNHGLIFENEKTKEGKETLSPFHKITLDVEKSNIELVPSDHYEIEYSYEETGKFSYIVEGDQLTITGKNSVQFYLFHFSLFEDDETRNWVKIYYPKEEVLDFVSIKANVGNIVLNGNHILKLKVESDLGNMEVMNSVIDHSEINLDLGNLEVSNSRIQNSEFDLDLGNLELHQIESENLGVECSLGNIKIDGSLKGKTILECSMGKVKVKTSLEEKSYSYRLKNSMGSTKVNGNTTSNTVESGIGENYLSITNSMGDIEVEFR